jgi:hypothetical protein
MLTSISADDKIIGYYMRGICSTASYAIVITRLLARIGNLNP